jgi:chaperonin cofactor prefoldin
VSNGRSHGHDHRQTEVKVAQLESEVKGVRGRIDSLEVEVREGNASIKTTVSAQFEKVYTKIDALLGERRTNWAMVVVIATAICAANLWMIYSQVDRVEARLDTAKDALQEIERMREAADTKYDGLMKEFRQSLLDGLREKIDDEVRERKDLRHRHIELDKRITAEMAAFAGWKVGANERMEQQHRWGSVATGERQKHLAEIEQLKKRVDRLERMGYDARDGTGEPGG